MKKTIEFLKKEGIIDRVQSAVDFAPKNAVDDYEKDPNMKEFQKFVLDDEIDRLSNEKAGKFYDALLNDIVYAMNIKKNNKEGDKIASLFVEIIKEVKKK